MYFCIGYTCILAFGESVAMAKAHEIEESEWKIQQEAKGIVTTV